MKSKYEKIFKNKKIINKTINDNACSEKNNKLIKQSMSHKKSKTENRIKENTKLIDTVEIPDNDMLNPNQFFNRSYIKGEKQKSQNATGIRQYHTTRKSNKPDSAVIDYLHTKSKDLDKQVAKKQKEGGYKSDDWGMATFGQIFKKNGVKIVVQSLVNGANSLITTLNKPLNELSVKDLQNLGILYVNGHFPIGASLYFASPNALKTGLIHPEYLYNKEWKHFGHFTQVSPTRCQHTGNIQRNLRETTGLFRIPDWLDEIPLAVSEVKANSKHKMTLTNGTDKEYDIGCGGVLQIYVSPEVMGILHQNVTKVIYQTKDQHGIKTAVRDNEGVIVEFNFKGHNGKAGEKGFIIDLSGGIQEVHSTIEVAPNGEAYPVFRG
ncbi:hypothetical protein [Legionella cincinnatiensis]|uniref:Uncharacterized protein n=1 Tax=Legionella cincinnatiensis TaxID=28085 RepID=A0A378IKU8_9GAMM|nr:hypothetical protein [Legionella cincinnatiensis]KTC93915.1 hypothetical protein Lcin_0003 [Legionella cincinnatiensis]STX35121.1 Uncharacterised protein [Legionella cincinnatiensis]